MSKIGWIVTTAALRAELPRLADGPLALDVEADSLHHYPERVCLLQLSAGGRDLLIDPLAGVDLAELGPQLADADRRKILHGADYDLRLLRRDFDLDVRGLFDTMMASRLVGERAFGLAALLQKYVGVELDKRYQRADWSRRPLPPEMQEYAALDTRHLETLSGMLEAGLQRLGREAWAAEEFARLERVRWSSTVDDPDAFRRVKHSATLEPRELAVLRELHRLRDTLAREKDRPPFRIVRDEVLLELARQQPGDPSALLRIRGLPRAFGSGSRRTLLLDAIEQAMRLPDDTLPERRRRARPPKRSAEHEASLRRLRDARDRLAAELDLEPSIVATRSALEEFLTWSEQGKTPDGTGDLRRWQAELLTEAAQ